MTLTELLPSLRTSLRPALDPTVWPVTARWAPQDDLLVGGVRMTTLVGRYGSPVHVLDEADVRSRCAEYVAAFGADAVSYSAKAGLTPDTGRWIASEGLGGYVTSAAELKSALLAGIPPARLVLCGRSKSVVDLEAAFACGAAIVVGSIGEVASVAARAPIGQRVLLRVLPSAGRGRCRYGVPLGTTIALAAVGAVLASPSLVPAGLDCSIGHQLSRFQAFESCLRETMAFAAVIRARLGVTVPALNLGGGHAVPYADGDDEFAVSAFAARIRGMLRLSAERFGIPEPRLTVSPGRAIVARAGLTLHRIGALADVDGRRTVVLDGSVPDCLTAEKCAGRHTAYLIGRETPAPLQPVTMVGGADDEQQSPVAAVQLPADVVVGDLVAVAGTGAYHHRRETFVGRPAVLGVAAGTVRTLVRRETLQDLLRRTA
ncbi:diaminopimelate decarboxylase family protein [Paractinoplanes durhamensis]|uniref:Diaminopimelate decarboxylase n=1 Tax=Paractinoplanes durhamensis TaxID=113563 RepID=A0ABQ3Z6T0_9ACTN|nr:diaminopimelate decarboxylase [Actinoplanes durhamensis]GIE05537.1 diaminopimelate decarboxylase [Actinoplanes durhamensis]